MAFWRTFTPSSLDKLLEEEDYTLDQLLDEDEFVQECKHCCNQTLLEFLAKDEVIGQMVSYIVSPVPEDFEDPELYRHRSAACAEVFLCEVAVLLHAFTENTEHVAAFLEYLRQPSGLDAIRDGFFCRVFHTVARSFPDQMTGAMDADTFVRAIVERLGNDSFKNDLLVPIMKADMEEQLYSVAKWMLEGGVVERLLEAYTSTEDAATHRNIAEVLRDLAQDSRPCLEVLQQKEKAETLMSSLTPSAPKTWVADTLQALMGVIQSVEEEEDEFADPTAPAPEKLVPPCVLVICESMSALAAALCPTEEPLPTINIPVGPVTPPLGRVRLEALHFFALLLRGWKDVPEVQDTLVEHKVLRACVDVLFSHPWHNIAHYYVEEVVKSCLETEKLYVALVDDAQLPSRMVEALAALPPPLEEGCAPDHSYHRPGNIGTILELAQAMDKAEELKAARLAENETWVAMIEGVVAEEFKKQTAEWGRGGLPDMAGLHIGDTSSSEEERDPDNNSSDSDEDDDPLRHFGGNAAAVSNNNMSDAFRSNTSFVNDSADAWTSQEITDSSGDWVANFESNFEGATFSGFDQDPWSNSGAVTEGDEADWKATFETEPSSGGNAGFVEDPFAQGSSSEEAVDWPTTDSTFEADFPAESPPPEESFADAFAEATAAAPTLAGSEEVIDEELVGPEVVVAAEEVAEVAAEEVPEDM